jgi:hypothetical protein
VPLQIDEPMSDIPRPEEAELAPFYQAIGLAITRWQYVESSLFVLMHGVLGVDSKLSRLIFFQAQGAAPKIEMMDRLCRAHFGEAVISEWDQIHKDIRDALPLRNAIAHWEMNIVTDPSYLDRGEPPIVLSRQHMDFRSIGDMRAISTQTATKIAEEFLFLSRQLIHFTASQFPIEKFRATNADPRIIEILTRSKQNQAPIRKSSA